MLHGPKLFPADYSLFIALSEPQARRRVSKAHKLPSGAIIVLITVAALQELKLGVFPRSLYAAQLMSPSLLRKYLAELVKAQLVERYTVRGHAHLRLTLSGVGVRHEYQRHLLGGARQYAREQAIN